MPHVSYGIKQQDLHTLHNFYDLLWLKNIYYYKRKNCEWIVNDARASFVCDIFVV